MQEHPSLSHFGPQQPKGRYGAPGFKQTSQLRQHKPIFPEHPTQLMEGRHEQFAHPAPKQIINLSSSTASSFPNEKKSIVSLIEIIRLMK
mmetsp:Transcript_13695/g.20394  ORF Transcript_13695/g.20394 Transcript_13695/m.20394 type:complete len:90 (-) Transcript_13695:139-408(-)